MPVDAISSVDAARLLGVSTATISRACTKHGIGTLMNPRMRVLSPEEVEQLRGIVRTQPGNPQFGSKEMAAKGVKARARPKKAAPKGKVKRASE